MNQKTAAEQLTQTLQTPKNQYRPIPFWSWNEKLHPQELRRQIRLMAGSGVGGYFMHARSGLETEYLEDPWFDCVKVGVEEGKAVGLTPWVYDEEGWPSGFAGGKVTAKGDWFYARGLRMRRLHSPDEAVQGPELLGVYACAEADHLVLPLKDATPDTCYDSYLEISHSCSPFYVDVMNKKVMREFLEETHERYAQRFALGTEGLAGFFTDEPRLSEGSVPWSYLLPDEFRSRYGYDLLPCLPALFLPCQNYRQVRHDFWAMVNDLFVNAYMKQIGEWCQEHNCMLTGHMMMEESLYSQMTGTGGGMPFYEFMQQPGVDSLRRNVNDPRIPKQVGSVAEQLGKKIVLTESYAMAGWDLNFDEMRWIAGWQYVNGVNLMCQHLQAYSLKGSRKRDFPPSLYYQQTWYNEYHRFNDYIARLGQMLAEGRKEIQVLLLHPMHSGWISYDGTNNSEIRALDEAFIRATELLSGAHIDYHLGDEVILRRHGKILENGCIQVGAYIYQAVVVPECLTMDRTTYSMLKDFSDAGHPLIRLGQWPVLCEGRESPEVASLKAVSRLAQDPETLHGLLDCLLDKPVHIREKGKECMAVHCCQVSVPGGTALYVVNMDRTGSHDTTVTLPGCLKVTRVEMDTLTRKELPVTFAEGESAFTLTLQPMETVVLIYEASRETVCEKAPAPLHLDASPWRVACMSDNSMTLDLCRYSIDEGPWQGPKAVIHLMQELLDLRRPCHIRQQFSFTLRCPPKQLHRLAFVMEQPHQYTVTVNGTPISFPAPSPVFDPEKNFKDISLYKTDILSLVRQGENLVEVSARFAQSPHVYEVLYGENVYETELNKLTYDMELESVYLIGDFGVYSVQEFVPGERRSLTTEGPFVLDLPPRVLEPGDFTTQGLTFFAGILEVEKSFTIPQQTSETLELDLGIPRAGLVQAFVDGGALQTFLWAPYKIDISNLAPGVHTLHVKLYASNRNLLGPHHHTKLENYSVGPLSFTGQFSWAERESEAVAITPEMRLQNFWKDSYSFVTFGV